MKKITYALLVFMAAMFVVSCDDTETYAEQKERERGAINDYLRVSNITVISESAFKAQNCTTDTSKNEFVLFESSGVYMQIIRKGCGDKIKDGETVRVLCRFTEWNLLTNTLQLSNDVQTFASMVDKMTVGRSSDTYTASFISGESLMASAYGSTSVPSGWLTPMSYINIGRPETDKDEIAKVRLIVPHTQGQAYASSGVYPCLYEITYERGR